MSSVEPLQLLRDYIREKKEIKLVDDKLAFGSKQLDVTLPTAWHPKSREGKEPYKLGELWLFLKNVLIKPTEGTNSYYSDVNDIGKKLKLGIISIPHQGSRSLLKTRS